MQVQHAVDLAVNGHERLVRRHLKVEGVPHGLRRQVEHFLEQAKLLACDMPSEDRDPKRQIVQWRACVVNLLQQCRAALERDLAQTALANAFEAILRPWLAGQARLDYRALQRVVD